MNKKYLSVAAVLAAAPLVLAGCGSSAESESTSDRGAVNNDAAGFDDFFDNNPIGENILSALTASYSYALPECNSSNMSRNLMLIANTTNAPQTMSVTINPGLGEEAAFWPQYSATVGAVGCPGYGELPSTQTLTVAPGQTAVALLQAGGGTRNLIDTSHNIAIGAGGQQWYDFYLNLEINEGFDYMQLSYGDTGGTDPSKNLQPGLFNVMQCDTSNGVAVTNTVVTPYWATPAGARETFDNGIPPYQNVQYGFDQPMCFAFIGEGADVYVPPAPAAAAPTPAPVTTPTDSSNPAPAPTPSDSSAPAPTPTSTIAAWDSRAAYQIGDLVTYQGATYRCTEAYQGYGDPSWITAPDLWVKVS